MSLDFSPSEYHYHYKEIVKDFTFDVKFRMYNDNITH